MSADPSRVALTDEVHLWHVPLDASPAAVARLTALLSSDERARAARFRNADHRRRFAVARGALRTILATYLRGAPATLAFGTGGQGKPALVDPADSGVCFNVAHSGELALCAVARGRNVGVDLEHRTRRTASPALAARTCSTAERAWLAERPADEWPTAFLRLWTCKEAVVKATGEGILRPLGRLEVLGALVGVDTVLVDGTEPPIGVRELQPDPDYVAAVASEGDGWRLTRRDWSETTPR